MNEEPKLIQSGPVFEAGPGWGFKVKTWLKKYFWKAILPVVIVAGGIFAFAQRSGYQSPTANSPSSSVSIGAGGESVNGETISEQVRRGDSRTIIARRAIATYLQKFPEELSAGQKLFLETKLSRLINTALNVGTEVEVSFENLRSLITEAKNLTAFQLKAWSDLAKKAGIR